MKQGDTVKIRHDSPFYMKDGHDSNLEGEITEVMLSWLKVDWPDGTYSFYLPEDLDLVYLRLL